MIGLVHALLGHLFTGHASRISGLRTLTTGHLNPGADLALGIHPSVVAMSFGRLRFHGSYAWAVIFLGHGVYAGVLGIRHASNCCNVGSYARPRNSHIAEPHSRR
jgi:hypothetical protein